MTTEFKSLRWPVDPGAKFLAALGVVLAALLLIGISGCNVNVSDKKEGGKQKVDIESPLGSLHVRTEPDPKDTGIAVYPGARRTERHDNRGGGAHVNIESSMFGLKVVAVEFESDDPPQKLLDFYHRELKRYGEVTECHGSMNVHSSKEGTHELKCDPAGDSGKKTELVVGSADRHRVVAVKPKGNGSEFALVYVETRGTKGAL